MSTHQQPCPCAYCRTDEINEELFAVPESKSPRLLWMEKHGIRLFQSTDDKWIAHSIHDRTKAESEDEALTHLALRMGIKLWHEEGFKP